MLVIPVLHGLFVPQRSYLSVIPPEAEDLWYSAVDLLDIEIFLGERYKYFFVSAIFILFTDVSHGK